MIQKWEHKVDYDIDEAMLNAHGQNGWELVAVTVETHDWVDERKGYKNHDVTTAFYFKRPIRSEGPVPFSET